MVERLSGDFNRGYTKAILDLISTVDYVYDDLRFHHKTFNYLVLKKFLKCCLDNREMLRDSQMTGSGKNCIRWNKRLNNFEFYEGESIQ